MYFRFGWIVWTIFTEAIPISGNVKNPIHIQLVDTILGFYRIFILKQLEAPIPLLNLQ